MISCKIFFQLLVTVFKEKLNLQLPLIFYSSMRFVFETTFISGKIAENRFGALLEISDKFITKFYVFSYMILQFIVLQIKAGQWSITANLYLLTANIYHVMIILAFPRNLFYSYFYFIEIFLNNQ